MRIAVYVTIIALISSCGKELDRGVIICKWYEAPRTYQYCTTIMCGKTPITTWHTGYDDEDYMIQIEGIIDGDTIHNDIEVTPQEFNDWNIQDSVKITKE